MSTTPRTPLPATGGRESQDLGSVARGGTLATVGAVVAAIGGLALTVVVGRGFGASGAGTFFEAVALFTILCSLTTFGADTGLLRQVSRTRALGRTREVDQILIAALVPVTIGSLLVTGLCWFLTPQLVDLITHQSGAAAATTQSYFRIMLSFLTVGVLVTVLAQGTRGFGGVRPFVAIQNVMLPIGRPVCIYLVIVGGAGTLAVPWAWTVMLVPALVTAAWVIRRDLRRLHTRITPAVPPARPFRRVLGEFWRFSAVRGVSAAIDVTLIWFDVVLVGILLSTTQAGIYATASRFITTGTLVMQAMRLAIAPQISALMSTGQRERAERIYRVATMWIIASSWPLYVTLACYGPVILQIFGKSFADGSTALAILSTAMLINLGTGNVGTVLLMAGKTSWVLGNKVAAILVNISLNLVLVPLYGISGAAIAWGAAIAVDNLAAVVEVRRGLGLSGYTRTTVATAIAALACYGFGGLAARAVLGTSVTSLFVYLVGATAVYAVVLWRLRAGLHLDELKAIVHRRPVAPADSLRSA